MLTIPNVAYSPHQFSPSSQIYKERRSIPPQNLANSHTSTPDTLNNTPHTPFLRDTAISRQHQKCYLLPFRHWQTLAQKPPSPNHRPWECNHRQWHTSNCCPGKCLPSKPRSDWFVGTQTFFLRASCFLWYNWGLKQSNLHTRKGRFLGPSWLFLPGSLLVVIGGEWDFTKGRVKGCASIRYFWVFRTYCGLSSWRLMSFAGEKGRRWIFTVLSNFWEDSSRNACLIPRTFLSAPHT